MMKDCTLREIEDRLPNGFHDARLNGLTFCLSTNEVKFDLQVFVGDPDSDMEENRERYRNATLLIQGILYFAIDPPTGIEGYPTCSSRIDGGTADEASSDALKPLKPLPDGAFAYWFYIENWNSFIHLAAKSASLQWEQA